LLVWLPEPLGVATLMEKLLTMAGSPGLAGTTASCTGTAPALCVAFTAVSIALLLGID
jgi:hypothetical protein